ncbi:MAG: GTP-binding protein [Candidatus Helarchaeota archaeon]
MAWQPYEILDKTENTENIYKIIVLGDGFVGKTAITVRFCENQFKDEYIMTIGVNFGTKKFRYKGTSYTLQIWDIAGQERFGAFRTSYYSAAVGVILVYDVTNKLTFLDLPNWTCEFQQLIGTKPVVVVGNKLDLPDSGQVDSRTGRPYEKQVGFKEGKCFADSINATFLETSAKGNYNIDNMFTVLVDSVDEKLFSNMLNVNSFNSIDLGFNKLYSLVSGNDVSKIYDSLMMLKHSIFQQNPYSVVLGNINEWINYLPKAPYTSEVSSLLLKSMDVWQQYYEQSLKEGEAVSSRI